MTQPLDFSSGAKKPVVPPPNKARRGSTRKKRGLVLAVGILVVATLVAVVVLDVFGDDSGGEAGFARYCQLSADVYEVAQRTGAASAPGAYDGTTEALKAAALQLGDTLDELRSVAPAAVGADVDVMVDALEQAAGGDANAVKEGGFALSAERESRHRSQSCAGGASTND